MTDDAFARHRSLLFTVAYEMLGSASDAEDVVQETWLRWANVDHAGVRNPRSYLVRIATRQSLNRMRTMARRREDYVGQWLPEPLLTGPDVAADVELAESLSIAMLTVLEPITSGGRDELPGVVELFHQPEPSPGAVGHGDGGGSAELHDGGGERNGEVVIEAGDPSPVGRSEVRAPAWHAAIAAWVWYGPAMARRDAASSLAMPSAMADWSQRAVVYPRSRCAAQAAEGRGRRARARLAGAEDIRLLGWVIACEHDWAPRGSTSTHQLSCWRGLACLAESPRVIDSGALTLLETIG